MPQVSKWVSPQHLIVQGELRADNQEARNQKTLYCDSQLSLVTALEMSIQHIQLYSEVPDKVYPIFLQNFKCKTKFLQPFAATALTLCISWHLLPLTGQKSHVPIALDHQMHLSNMTNTPKH